ncbi:uncharacterized protein LOC120265457 isoform X2 [Dioscorea cayenensis subsp. rotundata]|uniref:Uncharacterized protein LOC120265457 isoform X2 n=1 Tax=Dioscorea cayennensis subsp. rotundata TaxID=55577 RepID=A0AB40BPF2_DIOCR|nr:uncharacterized protein LOC120265457 isoform X2 [Dioscorea cayenensis subsp. rotundata]
MAKHVFGFLNKKDGIWVDVLSHKYDKLDFWRNTAPVNCSWFYRSLHKAAPQIKPFCRINLINPALTSFCWDPWCFDIPIALKPTFINMNVDVNLLSISDVVNGDRWCDTSLLYVFGPNFNLQELSSTSIDLNSGNHWIWNPPTKLHKISSTIYQQLNLSTPPEEVWPGWQLIWKLNIAPRTKHFMWTLFHGLLSTTNFLYHLNLGPNDPCSLCGLSPETIDHLFSHCTKTKQLTEGNYSNYINSVIAATAWMLWKSRCNIIFHNACINLPTVVCRALAHVQEYTDCNRSLIG